MEEPGSLELLKTSSNLAWRAASTLPCPLLTHFQSRYLLAQHLARRGWEKWAEAPVITEEQARGLPGQDEIVDPRHLVPTQCQIYLDKVIDQMKSRGLVETRESLTSNHILTSMDYQVIDGHHRWLCGVLFNLEVLVRRVQASAEVLIEAGNRVDIALHIQHNS